MNREDWALFEIRKLFSDVKLTREQMHKYQRDDAYWHLMNNPFSALFIDMGLGKTVSTATVIVDLLAEFDNDDKVLIVGPMRVATSTWPDEFRAWQHLAPYVPQVIHVSDDDPRLKDASREGRAEAKRLLMLPKAVEQHSRQCLAKRKKELREELATSRRTIHIISQDWIDWLVNFYGTKWPYRTVIIDESSGFKEHTSTRFMALQSIREVPGLITRMHLLTATPAAESYMAFFAQLFLIDGGERLGRVITHFRNKYFKQNRWTLKWELTEGSKEKILAKISDVCLVMKEEDYLPRVPPLYVHRMVHMNESQQLLYSTMEKEMLVTLADGTEVEAKTAAALSAKLLQMASGVLYDTVLLPGEDEDDPDAKIKILKIHKIHDHKMDMLKQIVAESQGKPILVSYSHRATLERLQKEFPNAVKMDPEAKCKKKWNAGKIPMLLMHPKSGGHGLNIQEGGHIIVFFDIPWSLELYLQLIGRLSRQGQKTRVTVFLLMCAGTMDQVVVNALTAKEDAQLLLFKILKRMKAKLHRILKKRKMAQLSAKEIEAVEAALVDYIERDNDDDL